MLSKMKILQQKKLLMEVVYELSKVGVTVAVTSSMQHQMFEVKQ